MQYRNLIMAAALTVFASGTFAKPDGGSPDKGRGYHREQMMEQFAALELSEKQKTDIKHVFKASHSERKILRREKRDLFKQLHQQDVASLTPEQIDHLSAEFGRVSAEGMRQRLNTKAAVAQILTPAQRELWQAQRQQHRQEMMRD